MILYLRIFTLFIKKPSSIAPLLCGTLILLFFTVGCTSDQMISTESYKNFTTPHQKWKSKRIHQFIDGINYAATEVPLSYYIFKNTTQDTEKMDSIFIANNNERILEIEFQHVEQKDLLLEEFTQKNYKESVQYMSFGIQQDFLVVTSSNDTIPCAGIHFERNFKVAPFKRALLYFNSIPPNETIQLVYQDQLFGNGLIKFDFNETPLKL